MIILTGILIGALLPAPRSTTPDVAALIAEIIRAVGRKL